MYFLSILCTLVVVVIHFYIFYLEVPAYGTDKFRQVFHTQPENDAALKPVFNNLGIYNLALAMILWLGIWVRAVSDGVGRGMLMSGLLVVAIAGVYLWKTAPDKRRAAYIQGVPACLALVCVLFS